MSKSRWDKDDGFNYGLDTPEETRRRIEIEHRKAMGQQPGKSHGGGFGNFVIAMIIVVVVVVLVAGM